MGIMRKMTSISTGGVVNYRNKDERANKYQKQTRNAARAQVAQNAAQLEMQRQQLAALDHGNVREEVRDMRAVKPIAPITPAQPVPVRQGPPPGWYPDQHDASMMRWFDGSEWTAFTQPRHKETGQEKLARVKAEQAAVNETRREKRTKEEDNLARIRAELAEEKARRKAERGRKTD